MASSIASPMVGKVDQRMKKPGPFGPGRHTSTLPKMRQFQLQRKGQNTNRRAASGSIDETIMGQGPVPVRYTSF